MRARGAPRPKPTPNPRPKRSFRDVHYTDGYVESREEIPTPPPGPRCRRSGPGGFTPLLVGLLLISLTALFALAFVGVVSLIVISV